MTNFQGNNYHPSAEKETALKTCVASVELGTALHRFEMEVFYERNQPSR
jgi:hypothetical protein